MRRTRRLAECVEAQSSAVVRQQLGWYMANCARSTAAIQIESVIARHARLLGEAWEGQLEAARRLPRQDEPLEANVAFACKEFGFDEIDAEIVRLLLRYQRNDALERFADDVLKQLHHPTRAVAALIGADAEDVRERIGRRGELVLSGVLCVEDDISPSALVGECGALRLAPPLLRVMHTPFRSRREWASALFGEPIGASLAWEDFAHVGAARDLAARLLSGAAHAAAPAINILVHGPVGTGKTEFCKTLAAAVGMTIWPVGEADDDGAEPSRFERIASLRLAQRLLAKRPRALILVDEAEDLLDGPTRLARLVTGRSRIGSKVHVNRLLEQNPVPVLWVANDVEGFDPAVLRRMTFDVEIKSPPAAVRARIWRRVVAETQAPIDAAAIDRLAQLYDAPPAVAANAARAARLAGGGAAEAEAALGGVLRLLGADPSLPGGDSGDFDPALTHCSEDLERLVAELARPSAPRAWSLCLSGPPGTGKSQFARHLAAALGLEVMQKRASDLLSRWVGDSEKQIAAAFAAARREGAMLVIDEADSLLADRRDAIQSWEVTQVNEMLTWMESHPLPFVCTTNLMERLDPASLRRFTLKLRFETLTPAQTALAFRRFFGLAAPGPLPEGLAPGDFATVRRKRDLFGAGDARTLLRWLDEEAAAKGPKPRPIGF